jgi:hypothetical protein
MHCLFVHGFLMTFSLSIQSTNELLILRKEMGEKGTGGQGDTTVSSSQVRQRTQVWDKSKNGGFMRIQIQIQPFRKFYCSTRLAWRKAGMFYTEICLAGKYLPTFKLLKRYCSSHEKETFKKPDRLSKRVGTVLYCSYF